MESENIESSLKNFGELDTEEKLKLLQSVSASIQKGVLQQSSQFKAKTLPLLLQILNQNLSEQDDELMITCSQTVLDILKGLKKEVETQLMPLLPKIIINLGDNHVKKKIMFIQFILNILI